MNGRPIEMAHEVVRPVVKEGDLVVDATAGNGHDTVFLAQAVGATGRVVAYDTQALAIDATRRRMQTAGLIERVDLRQESHGKMLELIGREKASAVMFNLGYLPGGDHSLTTEATETLKALTQALFVLRPGGIVTVICYTGHPGGMLEACSVVAGLRRICRNRTIPGLSVKVGKRPRKDAPFLVVVRRL